MPATPRAPAVETATLRVGERPPVRWLGRGGRQEFVTRCRFPSTRCLSKDRP